jgi:hypothetical protein
MAGSDKYFGTLSDLRTSNGAASIAGDKRSIQVKILYYLSQEARDKGYQPVRYDVYSISLNDLDVDKPLFSSIYYWLKQNVPTFEQAQDC